MPKCVRIDVREVVALAELSEPAGHTVRVHRRAVILCEQIPFVVVVFTEAQAFFHLPGLILL